MGFNHVDNIKLKKDTWVKITERSGVLHFKYDPSVIIYIYEGNGNPTTDLPNPDMRDPVFILSGGNNSQANQVGDTRAYRNRVGAIWAYSSGADSYVLKVNRDGA